ncbi:hypothetical protein TREMEDRAFT_71142 [Tremella mesenterica DSM 1558]|uniref:uncharacterized protein n=1 Tax=Tremella mesenterica (strain ATCC 24925 / CBS 8224 / DSM 1558 / NBRC 9311 / NRRL Y-6157 / RJB 2259-6 / UBC 559-6) TaxID=578456 RepID=UPI0003F4A2F1|nr:uncharacterized protein TREMEDRAFT_71142 [Tremella mesenterica DSM 1558]EIW71367.1 hypothetical protein TREMEDRAFT_71142 [Tremella mesenterica DSM 1558]
MAPIALTSALTSPPGVPVKKSQIANLNRDAGLNLDADGSSTPYSASSTAVSEYGSDAPKIPSSPLRTEILDAALPKPKPTGGREWFDSLLEASRPTLSTRGGEVVYASAIEVLETVAIQRSTSVWVYDDASLIGFGARALQHGLDKVHPVQTRQGAGLEIAGYSIKSSGTLSVFATTSTLPYLLPNLSKFKDDIIIHLATTVTDKDLTLGDSLSVPGTLKLLANLPDNWDVVFSSGKEIVDTASRLYDQPGRIIHVVESTFSGRETTVYTFPGASNLQATDLSLINSDSEELLVAPSSYLTSAIVSSLTPSVGLVSLNTLYPSSDELFAVLAGERRKTVSVLGASKADADALKAVILSILYSSAGSSKAILPLVTSVVVTSPTDLYPPNRADNTKTVAFYTPPPCPLPQLVSHLFLSSPTLTTRVAQFGSSGARGVKSVLSLAPSSAPARPLSVNEPSDVVWVSDPNVLKSTNLLDDIVDGGIIVFELPWSVEEVPVKLSRQEIITIKEKKLRVFLLNLDPSHPYNQAREQVAFLLLYTGKKTLPQGIWKLLDTFYAGQIGREEIEDAQSSLVEITTSFWEIPELEGGKVEKVKTKWEWDALPGFSGVVDFMEDEKPHLGQWDIAARHLLFREAYAISDSPKIASADSPPDADLQGSISALRPSMSDETFLVKVSENRRLTPMTYDRNVFHMELDTCNTGLKYEIGEAIGIHGWNDSAEVSDFCSWYGLDPNALVSFPCPIRQGTTETRTVYQLLQQNVDLFGRPGKAFYAALSKVATSKADSMTLKFISAPEGQELFKRMAEKETVTFADVLKKFKTARPGVEGLVGLIPEIKPRHYSIASSQKAVGDKVELLIVTVDWVDSKGSPRFGQCTRYLAALKPGDKVTVSIKPSVMKLPPSPRQPIIMSGLGTGAAPFRAFMQHRAYQRSIGQTVGPLIYYFGSRYRSQEYLYGEEIEAYIASGIISHAGLAFSRDGKDKVYIQHKMKEDKKMLAKLLKGQGEDAAYFYLCGPTWPVPDVYEALVSSLEEEGGMGRGEAEEFIEKLKDEERYVLEVY